MTKYPFAAHSHNHGIPLVPSTSSSHRELQLPSLSLADINGLDEASATKKALYTIITSDLLIPGDGQPLPKGTVVVEDKTIVWVGAKAELPGMYTQCSHKSHHVPYMMPGLWDVHVHFLDGSNDPDEAASTIALESLAEHPAITGARLAKQCWNAIQLGYTSMRDCGGFGCELTKPIEDGAIIGPNIYSSGSYLGQTAGHGDIFALPPGDALLNMGVHNIAPGYWGSGFSCIVDGVDECRRGVRLQIRRGAKCIKVLASGGVMSRDDNPMYAQFSPEELRVIVEEATRMERSVAAHVHGKPGIMAAAEAGVSTVEHATFADQECIDLIKKKGIIYVATRNAVVGGIERGSDGIPKKIWDKLVLINKNHLTAYKLAIENGLIIALGTDTPPGVDKAKELEYAVEAGMTNLEAIKAATANGPLTVKGQAPQTGQLKVGYEADILGVVENPAEDVRILQRRENIKWVWKGGKLYKGPNIGPWGEEL